jgi:LacI family transcriptional regulator
MTCGAKLPPIWLNYDTFASGVEHDLRHPRKRFATHLWNIGIPIKVKSRRKVALLVETSRSYGRDVLRGIADFARTRGNWTLLHQEMTIDVLLPEWMKEARVDGVIARVDKRTIDSLRHLGVPDDLGVIGVDDDDAVCPLSNPPLSSVRPNAEREGYRAAEILDAMIKGNLTQDAVEFIPPKAVVQRTSTRVIAVDDREVARVCGFIREHACDVIDVHDVAEFTTLSRRQLERRFRSELDRTPHEEITAVQIDRVKQLLRESDMTLEEITPLAGYSHKEQLWTVFKRVCGETPEAYRRRMVSSQA